MKKTRSIESEIQLSILNGAKIPHGISQPVLYQENGKYYLAIFIFFYNREDIEVGAVDRPTIWAIADIQTGEIIEKRQTKDIDFSDALYDIKYNVRTNTKYDTSKEYYSQAFNLLDDVRGELIVSGKFNNEKYQQYLTMILNNIPDSYKRFYTDLSV